MCREFPENSQTYILGLVKLFYRVYDIYILEPEGKTSLSKIASLLPSIPSPKPSVAIGIYDSCPFTRQVLGDGDE